MRVSAAVVPHVGAPFSVTEVDLDEPRADEVLVQIAGVGLCHTDIAVRDGHLPFPLPGVLGHEGAGVVVDVGAEVTDLAVGDKVVLSIDSCGDCLNCAQSAPAYCLQSTRRNFSGARPDGSAALHSQEAALGSAFFGQSSFASHALARRRNAVKLPDDAQIELMGPLGCGIQTGAGAVMNALDVRPGLSVLIAGGGSVGLAALLAGVVREAGQLIVVEPNPARRALALELGATHVIDPAAADLGKLVRAIAPAGVTHALDTTAIPTVIESLTRTLGVRGVLGLVGVPADPGAAFSTRMAGFTMAGRMIRGIVEGDADPQSFIPHLYDLHRQGRFPFDRLISTRPLAQINEAIADQLSGAAVKVVLTPG
ncbi:NAD(P)-dependent alcohol dehydrogenase [Mycolicibacterium brumae]|uniref:NAD(P)-dependent alcohol dehydrogenase n=1 Tax=Mycolicibacterium brumae TaxID=85968 RepID=A0A2G5P9R4_9MYCO|nr:NAD(P)-dependent alcohol dehydrogenase [Mycolicibacterium brumae]MCV7193723.1 NAD(P)-dependent alcohol dehydrogenase [Mycolicibacterium brumae]PIB75108.1 NAD(P)-dependent alcohol dehydrogenase [Mycolicibacterium brumae]RWA17424.1 hypothetical protein MBRU_07280 [Mycolicibacterium brumae DSM 44177]UWW09006.1 NAD(P)-dependent alcohol dehydrogenase [Mycolicibacterium brumae]